MRIVAFDLGTHTACVDRAPDAPIKTFSWDFKMKRGESDVWRLRRFKKAASEVLADDGCFVAYERPAVFRSMAPGEVLWAMVGILIVMCSERGIEFTGVHPTAVKKAATGKGNANKDAMLAAARAKWPDLKIETHDMADALFVSEVALKELG